MKNNVGQTDKIIRILAAILIIILYFLNQISGGLTIILLAVAVIFIATSFMGYCPIYHVTGISTNKAKK